MCVVLIILYSRVLGFSVLVLLPRQIRNPQLLPQARNQAFTNYQMQPDCLQQILYYLSYVRLAVLCTPDERLVRGTQKECAAWAGRVSARAGVCMRVSIYPESRTQSIGLLLY